MEVVGLSDGKILQSRMLKCIESFMAGRQPGSKAARRATFKTVACIFQFFGTRDAFDGTPTRYARPHSVAAFCTAQISPHDIHHEEAQNRPNPSRTRNRSPTRAGGGEEVLKGEQGVTGFLLALDIWVCFSSCMRHRDMLGVCESVCV